MIQNKKDYLYYLEADRIALGEKRKNPHVISIWESDIIWKFQRLLRKASIYIIVNHQEYTRYIINGYNIDCFEHK